MTLPYCTEKSTWFQCIHAKNYFQNRILGAKIAFKIVWSMLEYASHGNPRLSAFHINDQGRFDSPNRRV